MTFGTTCKHFFVDLETEKTGS